MVLNRFALLVGVRYSFSRKRNRFTSVIALISMLGMVLGVASLITVLSVMNGFANELRGRICRWLPTATSRARQAAVASKTGRRYRVWSKRNPG